MAGKKKEKVDQSKLTKKERAELAINELNKAYGVGTVISGTSKPQVYNVISTGSLSLDKATGIGGLPKGRIIEMYGMESTGKTTLCLEIIANAHRQDPEAECAIVDVEHSLDTSYAEKLGIDMDRLTISQPSSAEQALTVMERLINSKAYDVVVLDSVAALTPQAEIDGEMGKATMASQARLMSGAMRKLSGPVSKANTLCIFINQLRDSLDMFNPAPKPTGGNALKFYSSMRLEIKRSLSKENSVMSGLEKVGNLVTVKVIKNKTSAPFKEAAFNIMYGEGIDKVQELLDLAVDTEVIRKAGAFYYFKDTLLGQGNEAVKKQLKTNDKLYNELYSLVSDTFKVKSFVESDEPDDVAEVSEKAVEKEEVEK